VESVGSRFSVLTMACLELLKRWVCGSLPAEMKGSRSLGNLRELTAVAGVVCARAWGVGPGARSGGLGAGLRTTG